LDDRLFFANQFFEAPAHAAQDRLAHAFDPALTHHVDWEIAPQVVRLGLRVVDFLLSNRREKPKRVRACDAVGISPPGAGTQHQPGKTLELAAKLSVG